jgi:hypothetical protein
MAQLDQTMLNAIVAAVMQQLQTQGSAPKAPAISSPADKLAQRDAAIRAGFARRGIKNVTLMNRADPKQAYDVKPYRSWLELGYQVRKGERGIRGLFSGQVTTAFGLRLPAPQGSQAPACGPFFVPSNGR